MKNAMSYWLLLGALTIMLVLSAGGGLWGAEQSIGHWTGKLFENVCHQDPLRSLKVNRTPMAVNSRCFGIFSGLWMGWLSIPIIIHFSLKKVWTNWFLLLAVILQMIDYMGNHILWENNNASRVVLGLLLGAAVAIFLSDFFQTKNNED